METNGKKSSLEYFKAAFLGALLLIFVMYLLEIWGLTGNPGFVHIYHVLFGAHILVVDHIIAALLFAISGGIWGVIFRFVPNPGPLKGMAFGIIPSLWLWVVVSPVVSGVFFNGFTLKGILMPLIFNCLIWGSFTGWYISDR